MRFLSTSLALLTACFIGNSCQLMADEPTKSEDQCVAELLVAMLRQDVDGKKALLLESRALYPDSANMAYWRGRVLANDNDMAFVPGGHG